MLSRKAKYAIKALMILGKKNSAMATSEIYKNQKIPKKSLESILLDLKKGGYVYSKKGIAGGYILMKPPEEIFMVDIVRLVDGPIAMVSCASAFHYHRCEECPVEEICSIRDLYLKIRAADLEILSGTSIADMIAKERTLANAV